ncbi:MAG: transglycosylase SLT domain-containing protein [Actinobacteria bacterium]|nr:transglycosylase SLT domain-containing protein [Actinomycetota bacterium]
MAAGPPWRNLAEMDLSFARSRRRAARRRGKEPNRVPARRGRFVVVAAGVFALAGVLVAEAQTPADETTERPSSSRKAECPVPAKFRHAFASVAREARLRLSLLVAVAYEESALDPDARSAAGAQGLLQLMPATTQELEADAAVPSENVRAGARYLRRMLDRFGGDLDLALAAYNAGPSAVSRAGAAPSLETVAYVLNVKARQATLSGCD